VLLLTLKNPGRESKSHCLGFYIFFEIEKLKLDFLKIICTFHQNSKMKKFD